MNAINTLSVKTTSKKSIISSLADTTTIQTISCIFSAIMEEPVTGEQTICLLNVMFALTLFLFPIGISFFVRILFLAYLGVSVYHCKQYMVE